MSRKNGGSDQAALRALYARKAAAELEAAEVPGGAVRWSGDPLAEVALVKGRPGEADVETGRVLAGPDGEAARKALSALGLDEAWFAACSRPDGAAPDEAGLRELSASIEAVDPRVVIALDADAAEDLAAAAGLPRLRFGVPVERDGRTYLAVAGLEASLGDEVRKRRVWRQFRSLERAESGGD